MRRKSSFFKLLSVLLLTLIFVSGLLFIEWIIPTKRTDKIPIPKDTNWMLQVAAADFWKNEAYTVLFDAKDDAFLNQLRSYVEERLASDTEKKYPLAISMNSNVVLLHFNYQNEAYIASYFDVKNPTQFKTNIRYFLTKQQAAGTFGNKAIIVSGITSNNAEFHSTQALNHLLHSAVKAIHYNEQKSILLTLQTNQLKGKIAIQTTANSFHFNGKLSLSKPLKESAFRLKSEGFSIESAVIPIEIESMIESYNEKNKTEFPNISSCSVNYMGMTLADEKAGLPAVMGYSPIPKLNAILTFQQPVSVEQFTSLFPNNLLTSATTLNFESLVYSLVQLDENTLFIGYDPTVIQHQKDASVFALRGDLTYLTQFIGNDFIAGFIRNMPPIKASSDFFNTIKTSAIKLVPTGVKNEYALAGKLAFKKDKHALNEVSKFGFTLWKLYK